MAVTDVLWRGLLPETNLKWVVVRTPHIYARAKESHRLESGSAQLLGEGMNAAVLLASLQKGSSRVNLQLECDGPLKGLMVDASAEGEVRGYVKETQLHGTAAVMGRSGFLSVLRDLGEGEYYRSSVELSSMDIAKDLQQYFLSSDQIPTRVALASDAGVLLQCLPDSDPQDLIRVATGLETRLAASLKAHPEPLFPDCLLPGQQFELLDSYSLVWKCTCSKERVMKAVASLSRDELKEMIEKEGKASTRCQFCGASYEVSKAELQGLLAAFETGPK